MRIKPLWNFAVQRPQVYVEAANPIGNDCKAGYCCEVCELC